MGVLYAVFPVAGEVKDWVVSEEIEHPAGLTGRLPTPAEVRRAALGIEGIEVEEFGPHPSGDWQISLAALQGESDRWTLINATGCRSDNEPCEIGFEKGSPDLIVEVLHRLSGDTGPLFLVADTGDPGVVVWALRGVEETLTAWRQGD